MGEWFASGRIVDVIIALVVVEAAAASLYFQWHGRGVAPLDLISNLLAGVFLLLALRSALVGSPWEIAAAFLGAALIAHLLDLARRWR